MLRRFQVRIQDAETHESTQHAGFPVSSVQDVRVSGTVALQPLVHEAVQQRAAVVTEGGAAVAVGAELVHAGPRLAVPAVLDSAHSTVLQCCSLQYCSFGNKMWGNVRKHKNCEN